MRIGIEAQRIFRTHKHGMDFVALELIRNLQETDQINEYFIFVNEGPDKDCIRETANFKIVCFGGSYPVWEQWTLPKLAKEYKLDLLHCTSNTAPVQCPVPLVVTIHDIIYLESFPLTASGYTPYQKFGNLYRRFVVKRILQKARIILTVSHYEKKRFHEFFKLPDEKIKVVYNGVAEHFQKIDDLKILNGIRKKYSLPEDFILFLGNTDPKKNTANTVLAFARYCQRNGVSHKLVVGDIDPAIIKNILTSHDLGEYFKQIHFTGYINNQDLPGIMNMASIFLYPSRRESFGIPILEGMASGTAVITGNTSSMPEVGGDAALFVDPLSVEEITGGMERLLTDTDFRMDLIKRGFERVKYFNWKNAAVQVLDIYKTVTK